MNDKQDINDLVACANDCLTLVRCKGGRLIVSGCRCPHCDSYDPQRDCKKPRKKARP